MQYLPSSGELYEHLLGYDAIKCAFVMQLVSVVVPWFAPISQPTTKWSNRVKGQCSVIVGYDGLRKQYVDLMLTARSTENRAAAVRAQMRSLQIRAREMQTRVAQQVAANRLQQASTLLLNIFLVSVLAFYIFSKRSAAAAKIQLGKDAVRHLAATHPNLAALTAQQMML